MLGQMRATDLWRGDIILTSMKLRFGNESSAGTFWAPAIENSAINLLTGSLYSHAMLVTGPGRIIEFRNNLTEKSLRAAVTEDGKNLPAVAHVFRHRSSNGAMRERVMTHARTMKHDFKSVDMTYVLSVWLGLSRITNAWRQEDVQGMVVCSSFCTAAYAKAGSPLSRMNPHSMAPGDIALCADLGTAIRSRGQNAVDAYVPINMLVSARKWAARRAWGLPTLNLVGEVASEEYA